MKVRISEKSPLAIKEIVLKIKKRILEWPNPVEYVNNMYGSHPGKGDMEYFKKGLKIYKLFV